MTDIEPVDILGQERALAESEEPMTEPEARFVTHRIKAYVGTAHRLIALAYKRKAHVALGFKSWEAYVGEEFGVSRSYAYRMIDRAYVIGQIEAAAAEVTEVEGDLSPVGDTFDAAISERDARAIKPQIEEVAAAVKAELTENPDRDPVEVVAEVVQEARNAGGSNQGEEGGESPQHPVGAPTDPPAVPGKDWSSSPAVRAARERRDREEREPTPEERGAAAFVEKVAEAHPEWVVQDAFSKARKACDALLKLDPLTVVDAMGSDEINRDGVKYFADQLAKWAKGAHDALSPQLRRVK